MRKATDAFTNGNKDQGMIRRSAKNRFWNVLLALSISLTLATSSCAPPKGEIASNPTGNATTSLSGYVVVSNTTFRNVILMDPSFNYVRTLYQAGAGDVPWGLARFDDDNIIVSVEGSDRLIKVNLITGAVVTLAVDAQLTGTMRGVARLSGGDIIVSEGTTTIERFSVNSDGYTTTRVTGGWPVTHGANTVAVWPLSSSNQFLSCSTTTARTVRVNNDAGTQLFTASATAPTPTLGAAHDVNACVADGSGRVAVIYNGATDSLRVYNSTLATTQCTYSSAVTIPNPAALAVRANGNFLVYDNTNLSVVEIDGSCGLVATYSSNFMNAVNQMLVLR